MERLTVKTPTGATLKLNAPHTEQEAREQLMTAYRVAVDRLAAYEDGGIEPYHIPSILADNHEIIAKCKQLKAENAELRKLLKLAMEDMKKVTTNVAFEELVCGGECVHFGDCERVKNNDDKMYRCRTFKWRHADEVAEVLKDE